MNAGIIKIIYIQTDVKRSSLKRVNCEIRLRNIMAHEIASQEKNIVILKNDQVFDENK